MCGPAEGNLLDAIDAHGPHALGRLQEDDVPLLRELFAFARRGRCLQLLPASLRQADDRGRIREALGLGGGAGQRRFVDDHLGADIAFQQLTEAQRGPVHQHLPLPGHNGGQFDVFFGRYGQNVPSTGDGR